MTKKKSEHFFIFEQTSVVPNSKIDILEESSTPDGRPKIAYRCRLQESNVKNANRRVYSNEICESIVSKLAPKANSRSLLMEID